MNNPVQTKGIKNKRYPIGACYAIIPSNVDRDSYVQNCLRRGRISIQTEDGDVSHDCPVTMGVLQVIEFPLEVGQLGSQLLYNNEHRHNKPIIVDKFIKDDESYTGGENQFRIERFTDNGSVSIVGTAKDGNLFVNVSGKTENGGKIIIDVGNDEGSGEIVVNLKGDFKMELQNMIINALAEISQVSKDDTNINSTEGVINLGDIEAEEGVEPLLKGTKTVEQLDKEITALSDLLTSIANIIPAVVPSNAIDPTWAAWQAIVAGITERGNLSEVKSEKTFTE